MSILEWVENGLIAGIIAVATAYGTIRTTLVYHNKRVDKIEQDAQKKIETGEKEISKLETALADLANTQELCLRGCFSARQKSLAIPIWRYLRTEKGEDNFLRVPVYEKKHTALEYKLDALLLKIDAREEKRTNVESRLFVALEKIQDAVGKTP